MPLEAGVRLGTFEILEPLGAGGMGEVYRARDARLGRDVAIKVLPEALGRDPTRIIRFEREARLLAAINHPGIAAIYGAEEWNGLRYIVLELVPGETLAEKVARGALPLRESLDIARQIADALDAAHEKGVVHRDLKPSNVKITPEGKVKVLDFGLAKSAAPPQPEGSSRSPTLVGDQTRPGVILGTLEFMSPEQARGRDLDRRTDIWSFGCILFEMLSGRRAFGGQTPSDILGSILTEEPDWETLPAATPARLRELLERCLRKDPAQRLRDAGDARMEIEQCLAESPPGPRSRPAFAARPTRARKSRLLLGAAIAAALAVLASLAWLALRPSRARSRVLPAQKYLAVRFRDLSGQPQGQLYCDGLAETVSVRLGRSPSVRVTPPSSSEEERGEPDFRKLAQNSGANLVLWGTLQRLGDRVRVTYSLVALPDGARLTGDTVDGPAADFFQIQDQLATRVLAALDLAGIASTPAALRKGLENAGDQQSYLQALGHLQRYDRESSVDAAIALLEPLAREAPDSALVQAALGRAYLDKYKLTSGRTWAEKAAMACAAAARSGRDLPEVRVTQGELDRRTGRTEQAIAEFQAVLRFDPGSADAALGLAQTYEDRGELVEAEKQYRKAIELRPSFWAGYNHLGRFYYKHARYGQAAELFGRVAELTPDNVRAYNSMGAAYHQMGRSEEAAAAFQRSIAIQPNADAYSNLGTLEFYRGRYSDAVAAFERATALRPGDSYLWANLGDAYRWAPGKRERAATAYENAIRLARERLEINPRDSEAHMTIALCLAKTGQRGAALRELEEALAAEPGNVSNFYSAAIVNELAGRRGEALRWIRKSVDSGYGTAEIEREPEFGQLKNDKEFREALSRRAGPRPNAS